MNEPNRCARDKRCTNRTTTGTHDTEGRPVYTGTPCDRALCDTCADHLARVLRELADLYVQLSTLPPGRSGATPVSGSRDLKVPINLTAEALMRHIELVTTSWEEVVRDVAGEGTTAHGVRPGTAAFTACGYLSTHVTPLLALPGKLVTRWNPAATEVSCWEWVEMDGAAAALEIFKTHHRARTALGDTKSWEALPEPCWTCRVKALVRELGSNVIRCESCRATITLDEHEALVYRAAHMTGEMA